MIALLHGYLLEGSGSNLWTRSIASSLVRAGHTFHLVCQENHPELYEFVSEARTYLPDGTVRVSHRAETGPGRCVLHKPKLGDTLPVYVWDRYEEFPKPVPMVDLPDEEIERYLEWNTEVVSRIVEENGVRALHANHAVLMSVVARRVAAAHGIPYAIMPHGSAIEYAVRKDARFHRHAEAAFRDAARILVIGDEMHRRVLEVFPGMPGLERKLEELNLGVDTSLFELLDRSDRTSSIDTLAGRLEGIVSGKTDEQEADLREAIRGVRTIRELTARIAAVSDYDGKRPDAGAGEKLRRIDWSSEEIILFVGRLIASKGLQTILAALPDVLERRPDARVVVVGHGPLREPLEAFLHALSRGDRDLAENIVAWGTALEGAVEPRPLEEVSAYWEILGVEGRLDDHFRAAQEHDVAACVTFTGYLTHAELRYLFPAADVAVFPSVVAEAGPLVFLEALASGCFPLGTDFAGMGASIAAAAEVLPEEDVRWMRLSADPRRTAADIAAHLPEALAISGRHRDTLRRLAVERYDWESVSERLANLLEGMGEDAR